MLLKIPLCKWCGFAVAIATVVQCFWLAKGAYAPFLGLCLVFAKSFCLFQFSIKLIWNANNQNEASKRVTEQEMAHTHAQPPHIDWRCDFCWGCLQKRNQPALKSMAKDVKYVSLWKLAAITHTMRFQVNRKWKSKHRQYASSPCSLLALLFRSDDVAGFQPRSHHLQCEWIRSDGARAGEKTINISKLPKTPIVSALFSLAKYFY